MRAPPDSQLTVDPEEWDRYAAANPGSVLLAAARLSQENARTFLFRDPLQILCARDLHEIPAVFEQVEQAVKAGCYVAGFLSYEAGYHFEPAALRPGPHSERLHPEQLWSRPDLPPVWFGVYRGPLLLEGVPFPPQDSLAADMPGAQPTEPCICPSRGEYRAQVERIRRYIEAGDLYQANVTIELRQPWTGDAASLFRRMLVNQPVPYGALVNIGEATLLSASPELFFRKHDSHILVRPMKGTARRGRDLAEDAEIAAWLAADEKNRAENVMIVDLLRNDLGRICRMGSVTVKDLFSVERHPGLFQMTSTVCGELRPGIGYYEIFRSLFPCGSITGAPKVRTMQVIRELERGPRGIGCGAIGFFSPQGEAVFSVAIRTAVLRRGEIQMRVGAGITWDSDPDAEYDECLLKAQFLSQRPLRFDLIETMLWERDYFLLDPHLQRLRASAEYFDFHFDQGAVQHELDAIARTLHPGSHHRVRLLLSRSGDVSLTSEAVALSTEPVSLMISAKRTDSSDRFLRHKTTHRALYDSVFAEARARGCDDALFLNERGEVTECAIHNLMIEKDGTFVTPPVACGLLPGVYRRFLLETRPEARGGVLTMQDLRTAERVWVFNSVRGLRQVRAIHDTNGANIRASDQG